MFEAEIFHGRYKLYSVNGEGVTTPLYFTMLQAKDPSYISVRGKCVNMFSGQLFYKDGRMQGVLTSTMMKGTEEQLNVEKILKRAINRGVAIERTGTNLVLTSKDTVFIFRHL